MDEKLAAGLGTLSYWFGILLILFGFIPLVCYVAYGSSNAVQDMLVVALFVVGILGVIQMYIGVKAYPVDASRVSRGGGFAQHIADAFTAVNSTEEPEVQKEEPVQTNTEVPMRFCPACGTEFRENDKFCKKCGTAKR